jgi:WD40 repeat protein
LKDILVGSRTLDTCQAYSRDLESGKQIGEYWRNKESGAHIEALSPDGKKVVSKSLDGAVRLWDIDTGEIIAEWAGHTGVVLSMCWSCDGGRVVGRSNDGTARVWDLENGETTLGSIRTINNVYVFIYSPDATILKFATGGDNLEKGFLKALITLTRGHWIVKSLHFNMFITDRRDFQ